MQYIGEGRVCNTQGREVGGGEGMQHTGEGGGGRGGYATHRGGRGGEGRVCNTQGREERGGEGMCMFMCGILNCMHLCCAGMEVR